MAGAAPPGNVWVHDAIEARTSKIAGSGSVPALSPRPIDHQRWDLRFGAADFARQSHSAYVKQRSHRPPCRAG